MYKLTNKKINEMKKIAEKLVKDGNKKTLVNAKKILKIIKEYEKTSKGKKL